jgi:hypothetical protein
MFSKMEKDAGREVFLIGSTSCRSTPTFYAAESSIRGAGNGLFTANDTPASSSPIIYYTGEVLSEEEVRSRYNLQQKQSINDAECNYLAALDGVFMDASDASVSGIARLINHQPSDRANCKITKYGGIVPIKNIPAHTEIFYSYHGRWQKFLSTSATINDAVSSSSSDPHESSDDERH